VSSEEGLPDARLLTLLASPLSRWQEIKAFIEGKIAEANAAKEAGWSAANAKRNAAGNAAGKGF